MIAMSLKFLNSNNILNFSYLPETKRTKKRIVKPDTDNIFDAFTINCLLALFQSCILIYVHIL
jgi:hypothetical protein